MKDSIAKRLLKEADFDAGDTDIMNSRMQQHIDVADRVSEIHGRIGDAWVLAHRLKEELEKSLDPNERSAEDDTLGLVEDVAEELWNLEKRFDARRKKLGIQY